MQVLIKKEKQNVAALQQAPAGAPAGVSCYQATLKNALKPGNAVELDAVATTTGVYHLNPAKIQQGEKQYVEYHDNLYLLSPYEVTEQSTAVSNRAASQQQLFVTVTGCSDAAASC